MQRHINTLNGTISRLFGSGCQGIVGAAGHWTPDAVAFLPARSFGMQSSRSLRAEIRVAYYKATRSAAALLRRVQPARRPESRAGWRVAPQKWTPPRRARG
jgi:hypothetical protein